MRNPSILVPYLGPDISGNTYDIFIYLRPESNGFEVESTIIKVIRNNIEYRDNVRMVYFANFPGDYIRANKIIEHHYSFKIDFAMKGKKAFTPGMRQKFESFYKESFDSAEILNPFESLKIFSMNPEELFRLWVNENEMLCLCGQTIKKYKNKFIVNYDIPAILHNNNIKTDIAVMLFRVYFSWEKFKALISDIESELADHGITNSRNPVNRVLHFTKSPFEQLLDGFEYIYSPEEKGIERISFPGYLLKQGFSRDDMEKIVADPIVIITQADGSVTEDTVYEITKGMNYREGADFFKVLIKGFKEK